MTQQQGKARTQGQQNRPQQAPQPPVAAALDAIPPAAPLEAPPVPEPAPPALTLAQRTDTSTVTALTPHLHEGVVDVRGEPVDLADEFQLSVATGNIVVTKRALYETYRLPGSRPDKPQLGLTLLLNMGTALPIEAADRLVRRQRAEASAREAEAAALPAGH